MFRAFLVLMMLGLAACVANKPNQDVALSPYQATLKSIYISDKARDFYLTRGDIDKANNYAAALVAQVNDAAAKHNVSPIALIAP